MIVSNLVRNGCPLPKRHTNLLTYLRAGYPGFAVISSEEARAEGEIAAACADLKRRLHARSSTEDLVEAVETASWLQDIGRLGWLKEWPQRRASASSESAKAYGLPAPKGLLSDFPLFPVRIRHSKMQ